MDPLAPPDGQRLRAVPATRAHEAAIQAVLDAAPDYHERTEGAPADGDAAARLLDEAEADAQRKVFVLEARRGGAALGILDLHLGHPEPDTAHVGLLLFREAAQGLGYGREIVAALERVLADAGFSTLRLSVGDENPEARAFWDALGYAEAGRLDRGVSVLEKLLGR